MANGIMNGPLNWLIAVISNCPTFISKTGSADATAALAKIFELERIILADPKPEQGAIGFHAVVDWGPKREMIGVSGGAGTQFTHSGSLGVKFWRDSASDFTGTWQEALKEFTDVTDDILLEILAQSNTDVDGLNYEIDEFNLIYGPTGNNPEEEDLKFQCVIWQINWIG